MGLGIVLDEFQAVLAANLPYSVRIGTATVEVDYHDSAGTGRDGLLDERIIDLQGIYGGFDKYRSKAIFSNGKDGGDIGVGRHDDLVALLHHAHLLVGSQNQRQRIESVGTTHTMFSTYICRIVLFEPTGGLAFQIPA